jgi:hypothetical protein
MVALVHGLFGNEPPAIDLDAVLVRIHLGPKLGDDAPIDPHPPGDDQLLRRTPRCNAGTGKNLLQPFHRRTLAPEKGSDPFF